MKGAAGAADTKSPRSAAVNVFKCILLITKLQQHTATDTKHSSVPPSHCYSDTTRAAQRLLPICTVESSSETDKETLSHSRPV